MEWPKAPIFILTSNGIVLVFTENVNIFKAIEIIGLFLQVFSGFLFLLEFVLKSWETSLNKSIGKTEEHLNKLLSGKWFPGTLILVMIAVTLSVYIFFLSKLQGASLSDIGLLNLIIGIVVGSAIAGFIYAFWLRLSLWLMKKWRTTKRFLGGSPLRRFMKLNVFSFIITLILFIIFEGIYILPNIQQSLISSFMALLIIILGGLVTLSLLVIIVFLLFTLVSFITSSNKKFWLSLLTMWSLGGICLLVSVFYT